jgi:hypothetical protein
MRFPGLLIGFVVMGGLEACSGTPVVPRSDAGRDGTGAVDHSSQGIDASGADTNDGSADQRDASVSCSPLDVATRCPGGRSSACQPTWTEALANPYCVTPAFAASFAGGERRIDCGGYHIREIDLLERSETYYYDIASGMLVEAVYGDGTSPSGCYGPPQGIAVDCSNATWSLVCTLYGGDLSVSDAGLSGDGGGSNCAEDINANASCSRDGGGMDAAAPCFAACTVGHEFKYVGCVSNRSVVTKCYGSCAECP